MRLSKIFGDRAFFKTILQIGLPVAIQQLLTASLSLVDSLMIGALGENELAAVGMAGQFGTLLWGINWGLVSGGMLFFSQYWGAKDLKGIHKASGIMFMSCFAIVAVFTLWGVISPITVMEIYTDDAVINAIGARYIKIVSLGYFFNILSLGCSCLLRSTENVKLPLFASVMSLLTNTAFNWILIYGKLGLPALGVEGAALATVLANVVNAAIMILVSARHNNILIDAIKNMFSVDIPFIRMFFRKAMPIIINEVLYIVAALFINMSLGRQGAENLSALAIFRTIEGFVFAFHQGLSSAATVIVGKNIGAGQIQEGIRDARRLAVLCPILTVLSCMLIYAARYQITGLYNISGTVQSTVFSMILIYTFTAMLRTTNYLIVSTYRAGGESKLGMYLEVGGIWLLGVPLVALAGLVFRWPFILVFSMLYAEDVAKIGIELYFLLKNKWIKPVTQEGREGLRQFLAQQTRT